MNQTVRYKIGIDEAGRGPWAGPVVACAFAFVPEYKASLLQETPQLTDSKKLSANKRQALYNHFANKAGGANAHALFGIGVVDNHETDKLGIKKATKLAMQKAYDTLIDQIPKSAHIDTILIDGTDNFSLTNTEKAPISIPYGDQKIPEISAASIMAKVFRDTLMESYASLYPHYNFTSHKGYGTQKHKQALELHGPCPLHRTSYKPVQKLLPKKPKLLLHVCCGPDATIPLKDLQETYDIIAFWYDPNIHPKREYEKRKDAFAKVCDIENIPWIEGEYDTKSFFDAIKGYEHLPEQSEKCARCYDFRLGRAAKEAKKQNCDYFTTSLAISPHKDLSKLARLGQKWGDDFHIPYLAIDFRKNGGFQRSVKYCQEHDIYRQNYCGCIYSDTYPGKK